MDVIDSSSQQGLSSSSPPTKEIGRFLPVPPSHNHGSMRSTWQFKALESCVSVCLSVQVFQKSHPHSAFSARYRRDRRRLLTELLFRLTTNEADRALCQGQNTMLVIATYSVSFPRQRNIIALPFPDLLLSIIRFSPICKLVLSNGHRTFPVGSSTQRMSSLREVIKYSTVGRNLEVRCMRMC